MSRVRRRKLARRVNRARCAGGGGGGSEAWKLLWEAEAGQMALTMGGDRYAEIRTDMLEKVRGGRGDDRGNSHPREGGREGGREWKGRTKGDRLR